MQYLNYGPCVYCKIFHYGSFKPRKWEKLCALYKQKNLNKLSSTEIRRLN